MVLVTTQVASLESDAVTMTITYDTVDGRIRTVAYVNTTVHPAYLQVEPPGVAPVRFNLPANTSTTINVPNGQRPLFDIPISMGFAEPS